jgi:hypothetical protein
LAPLLCVQQGPARQSAVVVQLAPNMPQLCAHVPPVLLVQQTFDSHSAFSSHAMPSGLTRRPATQRFDSHRAVGPHSTSSLQDGLQRA